MPNLVLLQAVWLKKTSVELYYLGISGIFITKTVSVTLSNDAIIFSDFWRTKEFPFMARYNGAKFVSDQSSGSGVAVPKGMLNILNHLRCQNLTFSKSTTLNFCQKEHLPLPKSHHINKHIINTTERVYLQSEWVFQISGIRSSTVIEQGTIIIKINLILVMTEGSMDQ